MLIIVFEAFDDDLPLAENLVHRKRKPSASFAFNQDDNALGGIAARAGDIQQLAHIHERNIGFADLEQGALPAERPDIGDARLQALHDVGQRQDESLVSDRDHHAVQDGQGQWQGEAEAAALPRHGADDDAAAQIDDAAPDNVHADAAARDVGNL